jgi:fructoselysine 6-kinase
LATIIGVGDNVVDKYEYLGVMFPGGNALNVAVMAYRYGVKTAYLGWLGTDHAGRHVHQALKNEGVDVSRVRVIEGANAYDEVMLQDGERRFIRSEKGVAKKFCLSAEDYSFINSFDLVHTSVYSLTEKHLPQLKNACKFVSFDFSDLSNLTSLYLDSTLPHIDIAFFSGGKQTVDTIKEFLKNLSQKGPRFTVVTLGSRGSILYSEGKFHFQPIVPVKLVDTLGAGDAFIARCLKGILENEGIADTLHEAAWEASQACLHYGAFGYPARLDK